MMSSNIAIVAAYTSLNGLLILVLSYVVGHHRGRLDALEPGATGDAILTRAVRAHGNATEYIPTALLLLLVLLCFVALMSAPGVLLHCLGASFTVGRVAQAVGMMRKQHPNAVRFTGNLLTGLVYFVASGTALYYALS